MSAPAATNGNYALGSERFQREIEVTLGRRARRGQAGRPSKDTIEDANQGKLLWNLQETVVCPLLFAGGSYAFDGIRWGITCSLLDDRCHSFRLYRGISAVYCSMTV